MPEFGKLSVTRRCQTKTILPIFKRVPFLSFFATKLVPFTPETSLTPVPARRLCHYPQHGVGFGHNVAV